MLSSVLFFLLIIVCLIMATLRDKDAWPFSAYPMFSRRTDVTKVEVVRVALETQHGEVNWWQSRFYRYPEFIGHQIKRTYQRERLAEPVRSLAVLERAHYLQEVMRLIELEEGGLDRYCALHIVRRRVSQDPAQGVMIQEQTVARILLADIRGRRGQGARDGHVV